MKSFDSPNYTAIPNFVIDELMATIKGTQLLCMLLILRETIGYHRRYASISINYFIKKTGQSRSVVLRAIKALEKRELVSIKRYADNKKSNKFTIKITNLRGDSKKDNGTKKGDRGSVGERPEVVSERDLGSVGEGLLTGEAKERIKERIKKNSSRNSKNSIVHNSTEPPNCDVVALSEASFRRVDFLFSLMKKNNPKAKPPNREKWAKDIEKLNRVDGYSFEEIDALIRFSQEDDFWQTNILSAAKLRKQAAQLSLKMKKEGFKSREQRGALEDHERHKGYARYWVDRAERTRKIEVGTIWAMNEKAKITVNGEASYIFYSENAFKEQFDSALRKLGVL
jgi:hypothetical protein